MFIQDKIVQTVHLPSELLHSKSCQNTWMPKNRSSEAAPFRKYSPSHVAWRANNDPHLAIASEGLDLWGRDVVPFLPGLCAEKRLHIVPFLLVNPNVRRS